MNTVNDVKNVRQALIDREVYQVTGDHGVLALDFAKPVEDDNRIVERIARDRQERGNHVHVDLEVLQSQVMGTRQAAGISTTAIMPNTSKQS